MKIKRVVTKDRNEQSTYNTIKGLVDDGWTYAKMEEFGEGYLLTFCREEDNPECPPEDQQG